MAVTGMIVDFVAATFTGAFTILALLLAVLTWPLATETMKLAVFTVAAAMAYDGVMNGPNEEFTLGDLGISAAAAFGARQVM